MSAPSAMRRLALRLEDEDNVLTIDEAAYHLKISKRQVYRLIANGELAGVVLRLGTQTRVSRDRLIEWINERRDVVT